MCEKLNKYKLPCRMSSSRHAKVYQCQDKKIKKYITIVESYPYIQFIQKLIILP